MTTVLDLVLTASVIVLSLGLAGTTYFSWRRTGNPRLGFVTAAFAAFAVKGFATAWTIFGDAAVVAVDTYLLVADLAILLLLYLSLILGRRSSPEGRNR
jgi:hypothetical protein